MTETVLTERQKKWFATVQANFEKNTGKPLAAWIEIMKTCPETKPRAQMAWLKANHGVLQNGAALILSSMGPDAGMGGWDEEWEALAPPKRATRRPPHIALIFFATLALMLLTLAAINWRPWLDDTPPLPVAGRTWAAS